MPVEVVRDLPGEPLVGELGRPVAAKDVTLWLACEINGSETLTLRRLKASQFAEARKGSQNDEDQFFMRAIATATGLSTLQVADMDAYDFLRARKVIEDFLGF